MLLSSSVLFMVSMFLFFSLVLVCWIVIIIRLLFWVIMLGNMLVLISGECGVFD